MFDYSHGGWHMWWMASSWVLGLVMVGLFLWAWFHGTAFESSRGESPESILKRRYAQGEISSDDYKRRLTELRK